MRNRNIQIITRLSSQEYLRLVKLVKKSGLTKEAYIRHLINGLVPVDAPPPDYYSMMKELYGIGNQLNQIAATARSSGKIDTVRFDNAVKEFEQAVKTITDAVILPKKLT